MTDKKSSDSRRKLLKSIAAGSGAIVAGKSLPESWSKPVIDSVVLPAHAQTSELVPLCVAGSLTITENNSIAIIFDGTSCSLAEVSGDDCSGCDANAMLVIDNDQGDFDLNPPYGTNWEPTPDTNSLDPGTYTYTKTKLGGFNQGERFSVTFTVSFADGVNGTNADMTVSNVSIAAA